MRKREVGEAGEGAAGGAESPDNEGKRRRWPRALEGACEPGEWLLTRSAAHFRVEEIDGPFVIYYVRFLCLFFIKSRYVLSLF